MALLQFPQAALKVRTTARDNVQKRMKKLVKFYSKPEASQAMRRTSLVLQLTGGVEALMSATPKDGGAPTIVRLNRREGIDLVNDRLHAILENMHCDPVLGAGAATGALLATARDLLARLGAYLLYPHRCFHVLSYRRASDVFSATRLCVPRL